ncbi:MAG: tyrosine-type recombinase/integrase [Nitrososphaerales archaeon]|nr:tyrosine-type recombinase/integrase [Nitrososphaerales archaeon]
MSEQELQDYQERNGRLIEEFIEDLPPMSEKRQEKHRIILRNVSRSWLKKPFDDVTRQDLKRVIAGIDGAVVKDRKTGRAKPFEDWTKVDYKRCTKRFMKWHRDADFVKDFKVGSAEETVGPDDILTDEELWKIFGACQNLRDRAMSYTMYEVGPRPAEFLKLRKNDVMFDDYGAIVYLRKTKTVSRPVRVINAAPLLANWIENHPLPERDAPLWIDQSRNTRNTALKWTGLIKIVKRWREMARIEKTVTPYVFRHTRATHLAKIMTEAQLCLVFGWKIGSKMPRMYIHLSGKDIDETLLKAYGLKKEQQEEVKVPKKCVRCGTLCEADAETCRRCGMALTLTAALKKDQELDGMRNEISELRKIVEERLRPPASKGAPESSPTPTS